MSNDPRKCPPPNLSLKNERCRCHCSQDFIVWVKNPQCFVLISIPFLKIRPQEIALCISPSHEPPRSHQVVRVPFRFPPRAPPGHSVRNHPPTATPSTLQRHARSPQWADSVAKHGRRDAGEREWGEGVLHNVRQGRHHATKI